MTICSADDRLHIPNRDVLGGGALKTCCSRGLFGTNKPPALSSPSPPSACIVALDCRAVAGFLDPHCTDSSHICPTGIFQICHIGLSCLRAATFMPVVVARWDDLDDILQVGMAGAHRDEIDLR